MIVHWSDNGFYPLCVPGDYGCDYLKSSDIEIIGNHYENPELIK